jgi:hypothetical protein
MTGVSKGRKNHLQRITKDDEYYEVLLASSGGPASTRPDKKSLSLY